VNKKNWPGLNYNEVSHIGKKGKEKALSEGERQPKVEKEGRQGV